MGIMLVRHSIYWIIKIHNQGWYRDRWYEPYFDALPQPSHTQFYVLHGALLAAGVLIFLGWKARWVLIPTAVALWYHLFLNQAFFGNNRYLLAIFITLLCFMPCDRAVAIGAPRGQGEPIETWSLNLIRAQMSLVYLASSLGKLFDPDWVGGYVMRIRFSWRVQHFLGPEVMRHLFEDLTFWTIMSIAAICTELFIAVGFWLRPTRRAATLVGVGFHTFIELTWLVGVFSYMSIGTYFTSVRTTVRVELPYDPSSRFSRARARLVWLCDWLDRVDLVADPTRATARAAVFAAKETILFPIAWPLTLIWPGAPHRWLAMAVFALAALAAVPILSLYAGAYDYYFYAPVVVIALTTLSVFTRAPSSQSPPLHEEG